MTEDDPARAACARLTGDVSTVSEASWRVEHVERDAGEYHGVRVTVDLGPLDVELDLGDADRAEVFLVALRDAIVEAKRADLEWESDTDPSPGTSECDD